MQAPASAKNPARSSHPLVQYPGWRPALIDAQRPMRIAVVTDAWKPQVNGVAAADVFVFPSLTDTFGIVLLEAMQPEANDNRQNFFS